MEKFDWKSTIKSNLFMLKVAGLWPKGDETYNLNPYTFWAIFALCFFIGAHILVQAINLFVIFPNLGAIVASVFVLIPEFLAVVKCYCLVKNMKTIKQLMVTLNSDTFQPRNERQTEIISPNLRFWAINNGVHWVVSWTAVFFLSAHPVLDRSVKRFRLPFLAWYPFNEKKTPIYEITYIHQVISLSLIGMASIGTDNLIGALNMYISCQFDILSDNLRHINDGLSTNLNEKLINCINHHRQILKFVEDSNNFSNWIIFFQFMVSGFAVGITMFQMTTVVPMTSEFFSLLFYGTAKVLQIFMYCWFGNEVEIKSSQVPYAAFESDWTYAPLEMQKNLMFFIMRCQTPCRISALNLFYLSLETFVKILRTAYSYFALLNQVRS